MCQIRCELGFFLQMEHVFFICYDEVFSTNSLGKCLLDDYMAFLCHYITMFWLKLIEVFI